MVVSTIVAAVLMFGSSTALATAYGIAVTATMAANCSQLTAGM